MRTDRAAALVTRHSVTALRLSFGLVFVWFGALKIANATPVAALVAETVPFVPAGPLVRTLGVVEVAIGVALLVGRFLAAIALLMVGHLTATFLVLVMAPEAVFRDGHPWLLTMTGEFVVKNVILISAGLVLATAASRARLSHRT